ncbi:hypothetical protein P153DRAFT_324061 [Dothidotthia symphoricarpi CBS 119687]|uniref:rRNA-processing protein EFG1 n=1 Tax=Dothidotthia symphoricarpi CBS 119687 TaxID=1392245 RepID=A0A6A6A4I7_9PLEO|nr:uncharacterized protein P153DRAFT_324061 [Dothidotthia symphoricarpi CBS 119687]KAF2125817.1 hypothetical protein P153DRAFT_324061 [Dothidotthia symphoricarpi CBS 119687]
MSQKRKHASVADLEAANPTSTKKHRPFKPRKPRTDNDDKTTSANALKGRIRDLKRLLAHVENVPKHKMSAGARIERERELEASEHELAEMTAKAREGEYRRKMIGKYHQVRFFDRQKATRILKRLKKELSTTEDEAQKTELVQSIHNAQVDVSYAIYYPLMKPYSALYPKTKSGKADDAEADGDNAKDKSSDQADGPKGDVVMWRAVETAMEEGTLEGLRHSKGEVPAAPPKKDWAAKAKKSKDIEKQKRHDTAKASATREEDEDSEGGFFE